MISVLDGYYSWRGNDETFSGLARCRNGEWAFVYQPEKAWADKSELFGLLLDGDMAFEKIDADTAAGLAQRYGVDLAAPAEWQWDAATGKVVSLADGSEPTHLVAAAARNLPEATPVEEQVWLLGGERQVAGVKKALGR